MTKREFYERFRDGADVDLNDISQLIEDTELYDEFTIHDRYYLNDYVWEEINNWDCVWEELGDWLGWVRDISNNGEDFLFKEGFLDRAVSLSDVPQLLDEIEKSLEQYDSEWENELPESENDNTQEFALNVDGLF